MKSGQDIGTFNCHFTSHITFVPEFSLIVASGSQQFVAWNFNAGKELWTAKPDTQIKALQAIPKTNRIVYSTQTEIVIRNAVTGEDTHAGGARKTRRIRSGATANIVTFGGIDNRVRLWFSPRSRLRSLEPNRVPDPAPLLAVCPRVRSVSRR